jgi:ribose transport system permease protein
MMSFAGRLATNPGRWACLSALLLLGATIVIIGPAGAPDLVWTSVIFASFYLIVGLGQMLVMTAGNGNIDLSVPSVMTLAAYVSIVAMRSEHVSVPIGLLLGLGAGLACGVANAALVIVARIPPMIATLAVGFIVQSMAIAYSHGSTALSGPALTSFANSSVLGIPSVTALSLIVAIGFAIVLRYSVFGRSVEAIGQREQAAILASIRVNSTVAITYLASGLMAAAAGILLAAYAGGASLAMAENFLVISIAVVVIGGTNVAGGQASVLGVVGASAFYYLAVTILNILQFNPGVRTMLTGVAIAAVLAMRGRQVVR